MSELPLLPPDLWALILSNLPIHTLMQSVVGNRFFTREVLRRLPILCVARPHDLDIITARRLLDLNGIQQVHIQCLAIPSDNDMHHEYSVETSNRIVPFLSQFPSMTKAYLGGPDCLSYIPDLCSTPLDHREYYHGLLWALCGAFASRALAADLELDGLPVIHCLWSDDDQDDCTFCRSLLTNFPMKLLVFRINLNLCFDEREIIGILSSRPEAREFFSSQSMWKKLLNTYFVRSLLEAGGYVSILDYAPATMDRTRALVELGFAPNLNDPDLVASVRPDPNILVTRRVFEMLRELGFDIAEDDCDFIEFSAR